MPSRPLLLPGRETLTALLCLVALRSLTTVCTSWVDSTSQRAARPTRSGSLLPAPTSGRRRLLFCQFHAATYRPRLSVALSTLVVARRFQAASSPTLRTL